MSTAFVPASRDPTEVAQRFIEELTRESSPASSFVIRKDSYTDKNSGVSHIYARQYMHGIEVADGDINVNVKDGVVISYGDSVCAPPSRPKQTTHSFYAVLPRFGTRSLRVRSRAWPPGCTFGVLRWAPRGARGAC